MGTIVQHNDGRYQAAVHMLAMDGTRERKYVYGKTREEVNNKRIQPLANNRRGGSVHLIFHEVERLPGLLRKTVASVLDEADLPLSAIADQLGNTQRVADKHYRKRRAANEASAAALEDMFAEDSGT